MNKTRHNHTFNTADVFVVDWAWIVVYIILLVAIVLGPGRDLRCQQMGVDFRGYYASGQIAKDHGIGAVYDQSLQKAYQSVLLYHCPNPGTEKPLYVAMPYLPLYVLFFIPFTYIPFTASYLLWISLQLGLFFWYLGRFSQASAKKIGAFRILQWGVGLPLIANLYLGQINALLVLLWGEFIREFNRGRRQVSGLWLSSLLIKPHTLILLLPALAISQNWLVLLGFGLGAAVILGSSLLLAGFDGLEAMARLTYQFAGSLIQNPAGMMNWRALALNLEVLIPPWWSWVLAGSLAVLVIWLVFRKWRCIKGAKNPQFISIVALTISGTFIVSWHSHFYMHMLLVPLLLRLDVSGELPRKLQLLWLLGPPLIYLSVHLVAPTLEGRLFGLSMLILNIILLLGIKPLAEDCD